MISRLLAMTAAFVVSGSLAPAQTPEPNETPPEISERSDVRLSAGGNHFSTSLIRAATRDDGRVEAASGYGEIAWPDPDDPASGRIVFGSMTLGDVELLDAIVSGVSCSPDSVAPGDPVLARLEDVRFIASGRMLAPGGAPERISARSLEIDFTTDAERSCALPIRLRLEGVTISAADGSLAMIGGIDLSVDAPKNDLDPARLSLSISDVSALTSEDADILVLERMSIDIDLSGGIAGLPDFPRMSIAGLSSVIGPASLADATLSASLSGLRLPLGALLPDAERRRLGIVAGHVLAGDASLHLEGRDGSVEITSSMDIAGLAFAGLGARLLVPPSDPGGFSFAALAGKSEMAPLLGAEVVSAKASFKDDGIAAMILAATGKSLADHAASASSRLDALPLGLGGPVAEWVGRVAAFGGSVTISPETPVSVSRIAATAAVAPATLIELLGIATD